MLQRTSLIASASTFLALLICPRTVHSFKASPMSHGSERWNSQLKAKITADKVLENPQWPDKWPFKPTDFARQDESVDTEFYDQARLVYHIDEGAIDALTKYYSTVFTEDSSVLDICSSWVSHYPKGLKFKRAAGLGMNKYELEKNTQLTEFAVKDLNIDPVFPYKDNSFDFVTCVVSVDYLTRPLEVFSEIKRVLKPGGKAIISQSNRCFPTKAINIWLNTNDFEHIFIIGAYFHYSGGFAKPESLDISPGAMSSMFGNGGDPMYIIQAAKA
jgi:SAM-dependent methyltransferase